jgi:hypothetical protein
LGFGASKTNFTIGAFLGGVSQSPAHCGIVVHLFFAQRGVSVLDHPTYSLDLALADGQKPQKSNLNLWHKDRQKPQGQIRVRYPVVGKSRRGKILFLAPETQKALVGTQNVRKPWRIFKFGRLPKRKMPTE